MCILIRKYQGAFCCRPYGVKSLLNLMFSFKYEITLYKKLGLMWLNTAETEYIFPLTKYLESWDGVLNSVDFTNFAAVNNLIIIFYTVLTKI